MKYRIFAIGKPRLRYASAAVDEYRARLARRGDFEICYLREKDGCRQLLDRSRGTCRIALDERGERLTTAELAERIDALEQDGAVKTLSFLLGGPMGHEPLLRRESNLVLSLSSLTLQHELALVVLLEQLYRVSDLRRGGPYHRC